MQCIDLFSSAEDSSQQIESLRNELGDYNMVIITVCDEIYILFI